MLVQEFLENSAKCYPDKIALVCDGQRLTYTEIEQRANRLANAFIACGIQRGDRIVLVLPNSVELVVGIFATLKAGGVFVVIHHSTKLDKLIYTLNNCQASALLSAGKNLNAMENIVLNAPSLKLVILTPPAPPSEHAMLYESIQHEYPSTHPTGINIDLDLACLIYTSGSTGDPKGVMSDHSNIDFATGSIITYLENTPDDIVINVLPLSFDYGLYQLLMVFKFGGTLILEKGFAFPAEILKRMEAERITGFPGVPTIYAMLVNTDLTMYDLSSLRYLTNTAAALPVSHIEKLRAQFSWAKLYSMYGLTETKRTLYLPPDQLDKRPGSVGVAIPGTEVWLEDEQGHRLGANQAGELVVRGRHVMRGYWGDSAATARRFRSGAIPGERICYTGDLFRMDDEGYFYFVSRKDDIIKCRGEKVAPKEIENVLYGMPGVVETAVVGVPDQILGQAIKAFIVTDGIALTQADVLKFCRAHLQDLLIPQQIEFCNELPKTSSGKIKKTDLA